MTKQEIIELYLSRSQKTHKVQDSIALFQTLIDLAEKDSFSDLTAWFRGVLAEIKKDFDQALSYFQEATRLDKFLPYPWYGLAKVYNDLKEYEQAKQCLEKAIELDETWTHPWNGLGNVYLSLKKYDRAKEYYEKAIELDGTWTFPWNGLGNVYLSLKKYDRAKECYEKAIELDGTWAFPWHCLGNMYYEKKKYKQAKKFYDKAVELDPDAPDFRFNVGLVLFHQGKYSDANKHLQIAEKAFREKAEYKNDYWLARTQDLLIMIKTRQASENYLKKRAAQVSKPLTPLEKILAETAKRKLAEEAEQNQQTFLQFLDEPSDRGKDVGEDYFLVLRRWNSYTPIVADNFHIGKGGGYFLKINGKGIVIDPGFNFIDNFRAAGHLFHEIDAVLVSHAHPDHTADLESILTLLDEYNKEIKDSSDPNKNTIRRELAENKKPAVDPKDIAQVEIDKAFLDSPRRKIIDFYLTASVSKKYHGLIELLSTKDYQLHPIEPGDCKILFGEVQGAGVKVHFLKAKHKDIISDRHSVGFYIELPDNLVLIYTGDTGWNGDIKAQYEKLGEDFSNKYRLLLAHLGGVKEKEQSYVTEPDNEKVFYENHLGRLGLALLNQVLQPQVCIISEFGEELREWRQDLADIYQDAFAQEISFIPGDIGLKFMLKERKIRAIDKIVISEGRLEEEDIAPESVSSVLLRKDFSLHYFNMNSGIKKEDLVQILVDHFDHSQYKALRTKPKPE